MPEIEDESDILMKSSSSLSTSDEVVSSAESVENTSMKSKTLVHIHAEVRIITDKCKCELK